MVSNMRKSWHRKKWPKTTMLFYISWYIYIFSHFFKASLTMCLGEILNFHGDWLQVLGLLCLHYQHQSGPEWLSGPLTLTEFKCGQLDEFWGSWWGWWGDAHQWCWDLESPPCISPHWPWWSSTMLRSFTSSHLFLCLLWGFCHVSLEWKCSVLMNSTASHLQHATMYVLL